MSAFRVGQKVVCIDAAIHYEWRCPGFNWVGDLHGLTRGAVYTVRALWVDADTRHNVLSVAEIVRPLNWAGEEDGFYHPRFRPLAYKPQSLEHDVQRFKDIARHAPVLDNEDA